MSLACRRYIWSTAAMPQFVEPQCKSQKADLSIPCRVQYMSLATSPREISVRDLRGLGLRQCLTVLWDPSCVATNQIR